MLTLTCRRLVEQTSRLRPGRFFTAGVRGADSPQRTSGGNTRRFKQAPLPQGHSPQPLRTHPAYRLR